MLFRQLFDNVSSTWGISIALPAPNPNSPQVEKSLPPRQDEEAEDVD